jgi:hypothetical protein
MSLLRRLREMFAPPPPPKPVKPARPRRRKVTMTAAQREEWRLRTIAEHKALFGSVADE